MLQREGLRETEELGFEYRRQRFVYAADTHTFEKLRYPVKVGLGGSNYAKGPKRTPAGVPSFAGIVQSSMTASL
jgi:hypothetical protein